MRAWENGHDAYRTFRRMLESGPPPDDWDALLKEANADNPAHFPFKAGAAGGNQSPKSTASL